CVQTWFYFNRYPGDLWYIKCLVAIVWLFDSIHQALISHTVYFYVVTNFNNVSEQANLVWSILLEVLFNGLIGFVVQSFLTMRVWKMSNQNKPLTVLIVLFVLGELTCSVAFTISSLKLVTWMDLTHLKSLSMTVNVLGAVADVMIAAGLFYFLHRSRTGFKKHDDKQTGVYSGSLVFIASSGRMADHVYREHRSADQHLCCGFAVVYLDLGKNLDICRLLFQSGKMFVSVLLSLHGLINLPIVYSNSLLATLNARKSIRGLNDEDGGNVSFSLQTFSNKLRPSRRNMTMAPNQTNISIKIDTTQELIRDKATKEKDFESDITDVGRSEDTSEAV
ncbi:hypothetical protein GGU10DRAFT_416298, partial [Lentinula aff. detonsa]